MSSSSLQRTVVALLAATAIVIVFRQDMARLFATAPGAGAFYLYDLFVESDGATAPYTRIASGWTKGLSSLDLLPGQSGTLELEFAKLPRQRVVVKVFFWGDDRGQQPNRILLTTDRNLTPVKIASNDLFIQDKNGRFDLTELTADATRYRLRFESENRRVVRARSIRLVEVIHFPLSPMLADVGGYLVLLLFVLTTAFVAEGWEIPVPWRISVSIVAFALGTVLLRARAEKAVWWIIALETGAVVSLLLRRTRSGIRAPVLMSAAFLLVLSAGLALRWELVQELALSNLDLDARGYMVDAERMRLFTDYGFYSAKFGIGHQEPMFPFVAHVFLALFGSANIQMRYVSYFFSIGTIVLTYVAGKRLLGTGPALLATVFIAFSHAMVFEAARALRADLEACWLLALVVVATRTRGPAPWALVSGLVGGAWLLTRAYTLPAIVGVFVETVRQKPWGKMARVGAALGATAIAIAVFVPHKYNMYRIYGDLFHDSNTYVRYFANYEFAGRPGWLSEEELIKDPFIGPRITPFEYFFELHTVPEVVGYTLLGYMGEFVDLTAALFNVNHVTDSLARNFKHYGLASLGANLWRLLPWLGVMAFSAAALIAALFDARLRGWVVVFGLGLSFAAFLYGVNIVRLGEVMERTRFLLQFLPLLAFFVADFTVVLGRRLYRVVVQPGIAEESRVATIQG